MKLGKSGLSNSVTNYFESVPVIVYVLMYQYVHTNVFLIFLCSKC